MYYDNDKIYYNSFRVSADEQNGHSFLTSKDNSTILKVDKNSIKAEGTENFIQVGTKVEFIKGSKPTGNTERIEIEIFEGTSCPSNKKFCRDGITLCCVSQEIVGTCVGTWADC